jgi:hypothetical protein
MPNYCSCSISVKGDEEEMKRFYTTLDIPNNCGQKVVFSFHQTVPCEKDCNTALTVWGTKWDVIDPVILEKSTTLFILTCGTAWTPPIKWGRKVSEMFPTLTFTIAYCEAGMEFYGVFETNSSQKETITQEYGFLEDDLIHDEDEVEAGGRLKAFMEKHHIEHMGG